VLTNSLLDENDIERTTAGCKGNKRKRRDAYGKYFLGEILTSKVHVDLNGMFVSMYINSILCKNVEWTFNIGTKN
jgi:hypothetical protein